MAAAATARKPATARAATARRSAAAVRQPATVRTLPVRKPVPLRRPGGQLIPIAVGTATAVKRLPDSSLMVRMTQGRTWIGVLGLLLAGIVALNVVTLSLAASIGHIDQNIQALRQENSILRNRDAQRSGAARIRHDAAALGLAPATVDQGYLKAGPRDVETAARRLAAAEPTY